MDVAIIPGITLGRDCNGQRRKYHPSTDTVRCFTIILSATAGCGPVRLVFEGLGAFPRPREARVVWIGLSHGAETLAALQARIEAGLESLGFAREARPFTAHLTLGRVRGPAHREQLARALTGATSEALGEMVLDRIELMKSDLSAGGARYSILQSFPLG